MTWYYTKEVQELHGDIGDVLINQIEVNENNPAEMAQVIKYSRICMRTAAHLDSLECFLNLTTRNLSERKDELAEVYAYNESLRNAIVFLDEKIELVTANLALWLSDNREAIEAFTDGGMCHVPEFVHEVLEEKYPDEFYTYDLTPEP